VCAAIFLAQSTLFFVLPSLGSTVFLSPDETAAAVSARQFGKHADMRVDDALLSVAPWLHPRSFVSQGSSIVPVGFLGLPALLGVIWRLFGEWGLVVFVPLFVISVAYPLWRLLRRFGSVAAAMGIVVWMSYPAVILYANRGLFPNLVALCAALWGFFFLAERRSIRWAVAGGVFLGVALAIRPTEAVWILPWAWFLWSFAGASRANARATDRVQIVSALLAALIPCLLVLLIAWRTYGSPFLVGYVLHDPVSSVIAPAASVGSALGRVWPFGVHPRDVWFNFRSYVLGLMGAWTALLLCAVSVSVKDRKSWKWIGLGAWTVVSLAVLYGEAIYQDHVGINIISLGNSYVRYLVPFAALAALSASILAHWLEQKLGRLRGSVLAGVIVFALALSGTWMAVHQDGEGLLADSIELQRYALVRHAALSLMDRNVVVVSDRSDKIFFPVYRAVTPVPSFDQIRTLMVANNVPFALYAETLRPDQLETWIGYGFTLHPVFRSGTETLYGILLSSPTSTSP
jgi:hypothetical protein